MCNGSFKGSSPFPVPFKFIAAVVRLLLTALSFIMIIVLTFAVGSFSQSDDPDQQEEDFLDGLGIGSSITATVPGYVVADDTVCTIKLTKTEIGKEGNLNIYPKPHQGNIIGAGFHWFLVLSRLLALKL